MTEESKGLKSIMTSSPTLKRKKFEVDLELQQERYENTYDTCCSGSTDRRLIQYASKLTISLIVLAFSCIQIYRADPCDGNLPLYSSLLTMVLGAWIKTPDQKQSDK